MDRTEILQMITAAVEQSQKNSGRDTPDLDGDSCLIGDVPGCDSLVLEELALDLTIALSNSLGEREIPADVFKGSRRDRQPTLNEIAARVEQYMNGGQKAGSTSIIVTKGLSAHVAGRNGGHQTDFSPDGQVAKQNGNGANPTLLPHDD